MIADEKRTTFEREALPLLDAVYRVARSLTRDEAQAADLSQETMLKAYRAWHQFRPGSNVRAWLMTILRNTFNTEYRKDRRAPLLFDTPALEAAAAWNTDIGLTQAQPFDQMVDDEVWRAIRSLPETFRETLVLSDIEELSYDQIAHITAVPTGTVKSRLFRARQALQKKLCDYAVSMGYIRPRVCVEEAGT
jgi:RNA polymerase sigma-70 factor (ECF subfamily)